MQALERIQGRHHENLQKVHVPVEEILREERVWISERRQHDPDSEEPNLVALALSGGGIRSATFNLGLLQAAERYGFLPRVDYLSTVSGGGYIGSALTWFRARGNEFPFGVSRVDNVDNSVASRIVRWLRSRGEYLTPGRGLNRWALAAAVSRGVLLNLLILLPAAALLMYLLTLPNVGLPVPGFARDWGILNGFDRSNLYFAATWVGLGLFALLIVMLALSGLVSNLPIGVRSPARFRGIAHSLSGRLLMVAVILLLIGTVPLVTAFLESRGSAWFRTAVGSLTISGVTVLLVGAKALSQRSERKGPRKFLYGLGLALLLYGLLLLVYRLSTSLSPAWVLWPAVGAAVLLIVANVNNVSMHRFYRDRLMEAFLSTEDGHEFTQPNLLNDPERVTLASLRDHGERPYHLINTNLLTLDSKRASLRARGGESFLLSPLFCGSDSTAYERTESFMAGSLDLATALAISGAAVEPNVGATRSRALAAVMTLINARLGYWLRNPRWALTWTKKSRPGYWFSYFWVFRELVGMGLNEETGWIHLSDGGHFENLGLYELIRRRCQLIVVSDASADPEYAFAALSRAIALVRVDFGAKVKLDTTDIRPQESEGAFPLSRSAVVWGEVEYNGGSTGTLIYIKSSLVAGLPPDVYGYRRKNPSFPDQSTVDQFFDEAQFEAYRELGFQIGKDAFEGLEGPPWSMSLRI